MKIYVCHFRLFALIKKGKKVVLQTRVKVPPAINQFYSTLDRHTTIQPFELLDKYRPETKQAKKEHLRERAAAKDEGKVNAPTKRAPVCVTV